MTQGRQRPRQDTNREILRRIEKGINALRSDVAAFRRDEREGDALMEDVADKILAMLEEAETKQDGFLAVLEQLAANQGNPAKLQQIAKAVAAHQQDWVDAFNKVSQPEPPFEPSGQVPEEE